MQAFLLRSLSVLLGGYDVYVYADSEWWCRICWLGLYADSEWRASNKQEKEVLYPPLTYLKPLISQPIKNSKGVVYTVKPSFPT
jgi:hypothetical protein